MCYGFEELKTCQGEIISFIFKYALIHQSGLQNDVVIKTYIARLISQSASCVFYVTLEDKYVITRTRGNTENIARLRPSDMGRRSAASHIQRGLRPRWIWDAEVLYFSVFQSALCDNLYRCVYSNQML